MFPSILLNDTFTSVAIPLADRPFCHLLPIFLKENQQWHLSFA
ncbi:hypothetical protein X975_09341, partial [Stegodyphus mimosarum]